MINVYLLFDTGRRAFWKNNDLGYTTTISEAKNFSLEEAIEKAYAPNVYDLKIVYKFDTKKIRELLEG